MTVGLSSAQVSDLRRRFGSNIVVVRRVTPFVVLRRQIDNPLLLLLIASAGLSTATGRVTDGVIISLILVLSLGLGFVNEYRSERRMAALRLRVEHTTVTWRDGRPHDLPASELVPGDLVELRIGVVVPADGDVVQAVDLEIDESMLTGESMAVGKTAAGAGEGWDASNKVLMGSIVHQGSGRFVVTATGATTQFGGIVAALGERATITQFQRGLTAFSALLSKLAIVLMAAAFTVNVTLHRPVLETFLFCLSIAIGITPQLLPAVVGLSLSVGAHHLAERRVLVKRLVTIEDLGNIEVLFTDKTGTITEGRIEFDIAVDPVGVRDDDVFVLGLLCSEVVGVAEGHPEGPALDVATWRAPGASSVLIEGMTITDTVAFDHVRRMTSVAVQPDTGSTFMVTKGAPEAVLERCVDVPSAARSTLEELFAEGKRVVAIATKAISGSSICVADEQNLLLRGFLTFFDMARADAGVAIQRLAALNVAVKIVTGDNGNVAAKVCSELGIPVTGILNGADVAELNDETLLERITTTTIFSRVSPAQKARIISLTRSRGVDVGFLGDGVNDAAALHAADVGISVDSAVDVAREAADIVLLDKSLAVVADGIVEGRRIFNNTLKYVLMATSSNFGNMFSAAGASLFLSFLPLLPSQVLLNNLLYDIGQLAIPTDNVDDEALQRPAAWDLSFVRRFMLTFGPISSIFDFATFFVMLLILDAGPAEFRSGWFIESLATQTLVVYAIRTRRTPFFHSRPGRAMRIAPVIAAVVGSIVPFSPIGERLGFARLPLGFFAILVAMISLYLALVEVAKITFYARLGPSVTNEIPDNERAHRHLRRRAHRFVKHEGPGPTAVPSVRDSRFS